MNKWFIIFFLAFAALLFLSLPGGAKGPCPIDAGDNTRLIKPEPGPET